jgi:hypothetical protein
MKLMHVPVDEAEKKLLDTGLVFAINYLFLHPLGLALAFSGESAAWMTSIEIMATETGEPWSFHQDTQAAAREKLRSFLNNTPNLPEKTRKALWLAFGS